jgi:hypothetical protein
VQTPRKGNLMSIMLEKLYDALRSVDVPDDKARAAAVEVAEFKNDLQTVKTDLAVLKWMTGINITLSLAIIAKLFIMAPLPPG